MAYITIPRNDLKLRDQIGMGGFSAVYKSEWRRGLAITEVAVKRLNEKNTREAEVLSTLDHPNIVKLLAVVDEDIDFFLVLELCKGGSLRSYLDAHKGERLGQQFYDWAKQAARAIKYLKEKEIVHKDIKSPNFLIAGGNIIKLTDFGLARKMDKTKSRATETASYAWMAPELLRDNILSPTYDIYAFAVVVWELWSTEEPFADVEVPMHLVWRICQDNDRPPIPDDCPEALAELLRQCWSVDGRNGLQLTMCCRR